MRNWLFRTRLLAAFGSLFLVLLVLGGVSLDVQEGMLVRSRAMFEDNLTPIKDVANANMAAIYVNREMYKYITLNDPALKAAAKTRMEKFKSDYAKLLNKFKLTDLTQPEKDLLAKVDTEWSAYLVQEQKVFALEDAGNDDGSAALISGEAEKSFQALDDHLSDLVDLNANLAEKNQAKNNIAAHTGEVSVAVLLTLGLVACAVATWWLVRCVRQEIGGGAPGHWPYGSPYRGWRFDA